MNKRRNFIRQTSLVTGAALASPHLFSITRAPLRSDTLKIALVGCGGRGTGAAVQALMADENTVLLAMAELFEDHLMKSYTALMDIEEISDRIQVPTENRFLGFDAYQKAIRECDVVILGTPPAFRPEHFEFAVAEGKHVFMEKPLSCDSPGTRRILEAGKKATEKNLKVVVGLQNRYDSAYQQMVEKLQSGIIGPIVSSTCYYMKGSYLLIPRSQTSGELAYQIKNWHFFDWMWAGATGGLQIHNTDIVHWVKDAYPISVQGIGGRLALDGPGTGDSYDHFYLEYTYEDGSKLHSEIRTIDRTFRKGGSWFIGTKGTANYREGIKSYDGELLWKYKPSKDDTNAYQQEHNVFFEAIRKNRPHNDTVFGAHSSHAANMGRMAAQSGQVIKWEESLNSDIQLAPEITSWDQTPPVLPNEDGIYPIVKQGDKG